MWATATVASFGPPRFIIRHWSRQAGRLPYKDGIGRAMGLGLRSSGAGLQGAAEEFEAGAPEVQTEMLKS